MNEKLVAYKSKIIPKILFIIWILLIIIFLFFFISFQYHRLYSIIPATIIIPIMGVIVIDNLCDKNDISFEIKNNNLILYKRNTIIIDLNNIEKVKLVDNYGSFDGVIYSYHGNYSMHFLIKEQRKIYDEFIAIMKNHNIKINIVDSGL